ncbi:hypothetical protein K450DRAFT_251821 [Umbelopsis ramanniana AG]|uniref:Uncharacterized protein n=1 Tax=Umbelopsis ramanniana AG TaxID=1314678 RepID=A0AAD5HC35_UMBRA|nr:uncharacterized protein K450DRAFT_251821 [Umbelopsis ramanniana AG]KAI8577469.1 hypothetical protein K450DRAFT_251821 [Umbelopsis ramanniana AG]
MLPLTHTIFFFFWQQLSSALNKSDNDSIISGPDKKQKTGYVTITKYENSRESSPLTPRTVEHVSRFDSDELTIKPAGKQSPTFKAEIKQEESKSDQEKASTISISTRKLSADSTESINVTSPSPTRATPPPHIAFSSAGQENSANESGDENVDIDGDVQLDPTMVSNHSPISNHKVKHRKERPSGKFGDDDAGFASSLSSADDDDASDTDSASFSRTNGQVDLSKATLAKYRIRNTDEDGSYKRKPKFLPLNLPCKKLWMRNYLKESENAMVATKKAEEEAAAQAKKEPTPEVTPTDIMPEEDDEPMVDIVDDKKETPALPSPPHQETEDPLQEHSTTLDENDIFSDNESTASTVPADDLDQSFLSTDPISDHMTTTEIHVVESEMDTSVKEETVTEEDDHSTVLPAPVLESSDNVESAKEEVTVVVTEEEPLDDTNALTEEITHTTGEEIEQASHLQNAATAITGDADQESQPQSQGPKVVRLSVKEYLSQRAAAAHRGDELTSDEKASSGEESSAVA